MADYYIKCTVENSDGDILRVGYSTALRGSHAGKRKSKREVIRDIDVLNKDVKTAYRSRGNWTVGEDVHTVNGEYIRTDRNPTEEDNLENIGLC